MKTWNQFWKALGLTAALVSAPALAEGESCKSDTDCSSGDACEFRPCAEPACDPDGDCGAPVECPEEGVCVAPWQPENGCESNADCGSGLVCEVIGSSGGTACACPAGEGDCDCPPAAEPVEYKGCVPAPCSTDADCATGMECASHEIGSCSSTTDVACPEGEECSPAAPPECESETVKQCQPKWLGSCEANADCGEGFTCEASPDVCTCSGGSGTKDEPSGGSGSSGGSSGSGGSDPSAPAHEDGEDGSDQFIPIEEEDSDCTCEPSTEKYCKTIEQVCTTDAECAEGWHCEDYGVTSDGGSGMTPAPAEDCPPGAECESKVPAEADPASPPPPESNKLCTPPYYTDWRDAGALPGGPATMEADSQAGGDGLTTGTPKGEDGNDGSEPPTDESSAGSGNSKGGASAGCAVDPLSTTASGGAFLLAGLLALIGLRRFAQR